MLVKTLRRCSGYAYLAKFSNVTDSLALQGAEVRGDTAGLQVDHSGEWLVEKRTNGGDREATSFGSQGVNHGFEAHVNLTGPDDLSDICYRKLVSNARVKMTYHLDHSAQAKRP